MYCTFCSIVAREEPATIRYEDDDIIVIDNILGWAPVMLLVMPKRHMTQSDMWRTMGRIGFIATEMGWKHCPRGFRVLSNFGGDAMQSQDHAHIHIIGGAYLGPYL